MKNMFGIVPGTRYGWPKNVLHWKGIQESILDLCATVPVHFVIAYGIVAMEGNGPLNGTARALGKIVLADDPVAADATCARLMGFPSGAGAVPAAFGLAWGLRWQPRPWPPNSPGSSTACCATE
jgi:uncharacterized protein (DUF362 family)